MLLIAPILVNEHAKKPIEGMKGAEEKSKKFPEYYKKVAEKQNCDFLDVSQLAQPSSKDGCHLDPQGHLKIAEVLEKKINDIFD